MPVPSLDAGMEIRGRSAQIPRRRIAAAASGPCDDSADAVRGTVMTDPRDLDIAPRLASESYRIGIIGAGDSDGSVCIIIAVAVDHRVSPADAVKSGVFKGEVRTVYVADIVN